MATRSNHSPKTASDPDSIKEAMNARGITALSDPTRPTRYIPEGNGRGEVVFSKNMIYDGSVFTEDLIMGESGITISLNYIAFDFSGLIYVPSVTVKNNSGEVVHMITEYNTLSWTPHPVEQDVGYSHKTFELGSEQSMISGYFVRYISLYSRAICKIFSASHCYQIELWVTPGDLQTPNNEGPTRVVITKETI